jgi:hypothetical protein
MQFHCDPLALHFLGMEQPQRDQPQLFLGLLEAFLDALPFCNFDLKDFVGPGKLGRSLSDPIFQFAASGDQFGLHILSVGNIDA